jgi:hypothetical protein
MRHQAHDRRGVDQHAALLHKLAQRGGVASHANKQHVGIMTVTSAPMARSCPPSTRVVVILF